MKKIIISVVLTLLMYSLVTGHSQSSPEKRIYKETDGIALHLYTYRPSGIACEKSLPAVVFFFGGGWVNGTVNQFKPNCLFLTDQGIIGITAEYRLKNKHGITPLEAISDAKSAFRWLKRKGKELGNDPERILAGGGSAGGHLAAAKAKINCCNDLRDDLSIDPTPCELILFNAVLDINPIVQRFDGKESSAKASPINYEDKEVPTTRIFHDAGHNLVPFSSILEFQKTIHGYGNYCEAILFGGMGHGFFNKGKYDDRPYHRTLTLMRLFIDDFGSDTISIK